MKSFVRPLLATLLILSVVASCSEDSIVDSQSSKSISTFVSSSASNTTWYAANQADFRNALENYLPGDTIQLTQPLGQQPIYYMFDGAGLSSLTLIGESPRSGINMTDSVDWAFAHFTCDDLDAQNVFFEFDDDPANYTMSAVSGTKTTFKNCGWTYDGDASVSFLIAFQDVLFDDCDPIPDYSAGEGGVYIDAGTATFTTCTFEDATSACDFPIGLGSAGELDVLDWVYQNDIYSFENHGPITDQNIAVSDDWAYVEFTVGASDDNEDLLTVWARYKDDSNCGAGASMVLAHKNETTGKWNAKFYVGDFTDGDFYWRGRAKLCDEIVLGPCTYKHFRPGSGGPGPPGWYDD